MKRFFGHQLIILIVFAFFPILQACSPDDSSSSGSSSGKQEQASPTSITIAHQNDSPALTETAENLNKLNYPNDAGNAELIGDAVAKIERIGISDETLLQNLSDELKNSIKANYDWSSAASADMVLVHFTDVLVEILIPTDTPAEAQLISGNDATAIRVVVSDGITASGSSGSEQEILPNALVYGIQDSQSKDVINYVFASKVSGVYVQFAYRRNDLGTFAHWHNLGKPIKTDANGKAGLDKLADYIQASYFPHKYDWRQRDLQLKAEVLLKSGNTSDSTGIIRLLSIEQTSNHDAICTDHDNTLHETGGANTLEDILDATNVLKSEWPLVDAYVTKEVDTWLANGNDLVIITGMPDIMRDKAREQLALHFGDIPRHIPLNIKSDTQYADTNIYKAKTIGVLNNLYGQDASTKNHIQAMVGDTASEDGYGALANSILYVPFNINYHQVPSRLDTKGFGTIDPNTIAWNWLEVMQTILEQDDNPYPAQAYLLQ
jgi:hypothetical protein